MMNDPIGTNGDSGLISVIIPVYNVDAYLCRCLDSVLHNSYRNLQIICVDDGSTDRSGQILDSYAAKDPRFVVIHRPNGGVSSARNAGLREARGDYISFVDSDDWLHPQFFESLLRIAAAADCELVISGFVRTAEYAVPEAVDPGQLRWDSLDAAQMLSRRETKNFVSGRLYRKELVRDCLFPESISFSEDTLFNAAVVLRSPGLSIAYTGQPLYFYYNRPGSMVRQSSSRDLVRVGKTLLRCAQQAGEPAVKAVLLKEGLKKLLSARYVMSVKAEPKESYRECSALLRSCCREVLRSGRLSAAETAIYPILCACPQAYRLWRIRDDPSLLDWERSCRAQRNSGS